MQFELEGGNLVIDLKEDLDTLCERSAVSDEFPLLPGATVRVQQTIFGNDARARFNRDGDLDVMIPRNQIILPTTIEEQAIAVAAEARPALTERGIGVARIILTAGNTDA